MPQVIGLLCLRSLPSYALQRSPIGHLQCHAFINLSCNDVRQLYALLGGDPRGSVLLALSSADHQASELSATVLTNRWFAFLKDSLDEYLMESCDSLVASQCISLQAPGLESTLWHL